jgi:hypothetical protein
VPEDWVVVPARAGEPMSPVVQVGEPEPVSATVRWVMRFWTSRVKVVDLAPSVMAVLRSEES